MGHPPGMGFLSGLQQWAVASPQDPGTESERVVMTNVVPGSSETQIKEPFSVRLMG